MSWKVAQDQSFAPKPHHPGVSPTETPPDDATHAIWQDPSSYDPLYHGPPYLPGMKVRMDKSASLKGGFRSFVAGVTLDTPEVPLILIFLRTLAFIHQSHHWLTFGETFMGDHLLFERIYNETVGEIDQIGEKALGIGCHPQYLHPGHQAHLMALTTMHFCGVVYGENGEGIDPNSYVDISLNAERKFLQAAKIIADGMQAKGTLTRGVDNLLAGIEDKHESHVYLLGQRSKANPWKATGA